ncbi:MAG: DUF2934 domain-containing protein [Gallionella sp.]|jgi:hypothetical protein
MVEEKKKPAVKKTVASKVAADSEVKVTKVAAKKAPAAKKAAAETGVWPFPEVEKVAEAKKAPAKKAAVKKTAAVAQPSAEERYRMVETAAYFIAERSGFQGCNTEHWAAAELEIANKLGC